MPSRKKRTKERLPRTTSSEDEEEPLVEDEETEQPNVAAVEDQDDEEEPPALANPFIAWFVQETSGNPVDFEFTAGFAKLVEKNDTLSSRIHRIVAQGGVHLLVRQVCNSSWGGGGNVHL